MLRAAEGAGAVVSAPAESLPFCSEVFDAVTAGQSWHWFEATATARECLRVLRPGGTLVIAHFDYLADRAGVAAETEKLILRFNPAWAMAGGNGRYDKWRRQLEAFADVRSFFYDEEVAYSREGWRGRMRACNGALAVHDEATRAGLDKAIGEMLAPLGEPLIVLHRVFVMQGRKPH
jgi:SAM-dependent methyltransferase